MQPHRPCELGRQATMGWSCTGRHHAVCGHLAQKQEHMTPMQVPTVITVSIGLFIRFVCPVPEGHRRLVKTFSCMAQRVMSHDVSCAGCCLSTRSLRAGPFCLRALRGHGTLLKGVGLRDFDCLTGLYDLQRWSEPPLPLGQVAGIVTQPLPSAGGMTGNAGVELAAAFNVRRRFLCACCGTDAEGLPAVLLDTSEIERGI